MTRSQSRVAGVVLAAGEGTRLRPLTATRPKALCPVGNVPLLDLALARLAPHTGSGAGNLAVNAFHHADQVVAHSGNDVHVSVETGEEALGTAGALAPLRDWLDGRDVLLTNADSYLPDGLPGFLDGWDGRRCRLLCAPAGDGRPDFVDDSGRGVRYVGACLLPWARVSVLEATPSGLYEVMWRGDVAEHLLDLVVTEATAIDCGTPAEYLAANLSASGGAPVIGDGAEVLGTVTRSVVWSGAYVGPEESLDSVIRAGSRSAPVTVPA